MRVLVDATALVVGDTGVARYAAQLLAALPAAGVHVQAVALGRGTPSSVATARACGVRHLPVPARLAQSWWQRAAVPRLEQLPSGGGAPGTAPALAHTLDLPPAPTRLPVVLTVHDLDALAAPHLHPPVGAALQRRQLDAARRAAAVCVPSAAVRGQLEGRGVDPARVVVTPLGRTPLPPARPPVGLEPGFVLAVGALSLRKGFDVLVDAVALLPGVRLVHAGPDGHGAEGLRARAAALGGRAALLGRVGDAELAGLYAGAGALAFPSRAEGFGLPVLEALGAGVPVVASDLPVLREVAGGCALLVTVDDAGALAAGLAGALAGGPQVSERVEQGRRRAAARTWAACAEATVTAYELALRG